MLAVAGAAVVAGSVVVASGASASNIGFAAVVGGGSGVLLGGTQVGRIATLVALVVIVGLISNVGLAVTDGRLVLVGLGSGVSVDTAVFVGDTDVYDGTGVFVASAGDGEGGTGGTLVGEGKISVTTGGWVIGVSLGSGVSLGNTVMAGVSLGNIVMVASAFRLAGVLVGSSNDSGVLVPNTASVRLGSGVTVACVIIGFGFALLFCSSK